MRGILRRGPAVGSDFNHTRMCLNAAEAKEQLGAWQQLGDFRIAGAPHETRTKLSALTFLQSSHIWIERSFESTTRDANHNHRCVSAHPGEEIPPTVTSHYARICA